MNSKLENFLLTKDFDELSSLDKVFVTEFVTELEYADFRQFLMRSKEVFQNDNDNLKHPKLNSTALLEAYRKKYYTPQPNVIHQHKKAFNYVSNPMIAGIAAIFILAILIFKFNDNLKSSNSDPRVVTEFLLQGKELPKLNDVKLDVNSSNEVAVSGKKKIDSFIRESKTMNDYMAIETYGLEVEAIVSD